MKQTDFLLGGENKLLDLKINFCDSILGILSLSVLPKGSTFLLSPTRLDPVGGKGVSFFLPTWILLVVLRRGLQIPLGSHLGLLFEQGCVPRAPATKNDLLFLRSTFSILPCLCTRSHLGLEYLLFPVNICFTLNNPSQTFSSGRQLCVGLPLSNGCLPPCS